MIIYEDDKSIEFKIHEYQFKNERSREDYNYDANWLICKFIYTENGACEEYRDACLLTSELSELRQEFESIIKCESKSYISDFLEPYLKFCFVRVNNDVLVTLHFVYDTTDGHWKTRKVASIITLEAAKELLEELKKMESSYPKR